MSACMMIAISCPRCLNRGYVGKDKLPGTLACSKCGHAAHFEGDSDAAPKPTARRSVPELFADGSLDQDALVRLWRATRDK